MWHPISFSIWPRRLRFFSSSSEVNSQGCIVLLLSSGHLLPWPDGPSSGLATARKCQYPLCSLDRASRSGVRDWPKFLHCQKVSLDWSTIYLLFTSFLSTSIRFSRSRTSLLWLSVSFFLYSSFNWIPTVVFCDFSPINSTTPPFFPKPPASFFPPLHSQWLPLLSNKRTSRVMLPSTRLFTESLPRPVVVWLLCVARTPLLRRPPSMSTSSTGITRAISMRPMRLAR